METSRSYPRTMQQAFGAYTNNTLHPMGSDKFKPRRRKLAPHLVAYLLIVVIMTVCALIVAGVK